MEGRNALGKRRTGKLREKDARAIGGRDEDRAEGCPEDYDEDGERESEGEKAFEGKRPPVRGRCATGLFGALI
jgi:hypothetical protein